jgi:hypothetical protein
LAQPSKILTDTFHTLSVIQQAFSFITYLMVVSIKISCNFGTFISAFEQPMMGIFRGFACESEKLSDYKNYNYKL